MTILFFCATLFAQVNMPKPKPSGPDRDNPWAREMWFHRGRTMPGKPGAAARLLRHAYQQKLLLRAAHLKAMRAAGLASYSTYSASTTVSANSITAPDYGGWVPLGPSPLNSNASGSLDDQDYGPVTGRATSVVADPGDPTGNTVYLGGAYGGLWKSTNAAAADPSTVVWTPLIDQQATLAVGAVAVQPSKNAPSNVILVGTGEANFSIDSYYGLGILRSADAGNTWTLISSAGTLNFSGLTFARIAFSTDNPNLVVAATTGAGNDEGAGNPGGNTPGLYTSTDGGSTWALTQPGLSPVGASSVVYDSTGHKFFAVMQFDGLYTSGNGTTWHRLASQPGTTLQNCPIGNTGTPICNMFRGELAVVPGREELYTWYVTIDNQGNIGDGGIYKSTNAGTSWIQLNESGLTNCGDGTGNGCGTQQGWYNLTLAAVPHGTGTDLYAGAVNLFKCSITGANSTCGVNPFLNLTHAYGCSPLGSLSHVHPDQHGISFVQVNASKVVMYFANDGGIYRALNGYALNSGACGSAPNPFQNLNGTMGSMTEFVDFSNSPTDPATLVGGTQDNGSPATDSNHGASWISVNGGDGGYNAIDPSSGYWFTSNTDVSVQRCNAGINCLSQTFDPIVTNSTVGGDHGFFYTPFMLDPQADSRMLVGTCRLWRGNSDGTGFAPLSYNFDSVLNQTLNQACTGNETELIRSIAAGGPDTGNGSSVIYVGTEGGYSANSPYPGPGHLWVTNNADLGPFTWANFFAPWDGAYPLSSVAVDPSDPTGDTAYATVMGFGLGHVLQTTNQGANWNQPPSSNLPNAPVNDFLIDPDDSSTFYVATDVGVYTSQDLQNWTELGHLPSVAVLHLHMFESGGVKQLRAGTYGRGIWSYDIPYQIKITTPKVSLSPGQSGTIDGIITGYNGYTSPVTIECPASINLGACTPTTVTPMPSGTPFSLAITAGTAVQTFTFALQGTGTDPNSTIETSGPVTVSITDYTFGWSTTIAVNQGTTSGEDSFDLFYGNPITLTCSGMPKGAVCNFFPSSTVPPFTNSVTLSVSAATDTPTGTYNVTITASTPSQSSPKTASLVLTVGSAPDYDLVVTPPSGVLTVGSSATGQITLTPVAGYTGPVTLSSYASSGLVHWSPASPGPFTFSGTPITIPVTFSVPFAGVGGQVTPITFYSYGPGTDSHFVFISVTVMDFTLTARTDSAATVAGQNAQYELFVNSPGPPFTNPVSFSCSGLPAGSTCSFSPATVTPNGSSVPVILTVTTAASSAQLQQPASPATEAQFMIALLLPGIVLGFSGDGRRKKASLILLLIVVLAILLLQPACGGGGTSAPPPAPPSPPSPPPPSAPPPPSGYYFYVNGTSGSAQHQLGLNLTVYPK